MPSKTCRHTSPAGFTLVELMVVISLIGIMTAMILPAMKGTFEDALLRSAGRKLAAACSLASSRAVAVNQMHRVRLDRKNNRYVIEQPVRNKEEGGDYRPRDIAGGEGELDARIAIEIKKPLDEEERDAEERPDQSKRDNDVLAFYPDGTADAAEIVLKDREGFRLALRISPVSGRIDIKEMDPQP